MAHHGQKLIILIQRDMEQEGLEHQPELYVLQGQREEQTERLLQKLGMELLGQKRRI